MMKKYPPFDADFGMDENEYNKDVGIPGKFNVPFKDIPAVKIQH